MRQLLGKQRDLRPPNEINQKKKKKSQKTQKTCFEPCVEQENNLSLLNQ